MSSIGPSCSIVDLSSRTFRAINAAVMAWHIGDWFWEWVSDERPELLQDIANYLGVTFRHSTRDKHHVFSTMSKGFADNHRSLAICRTISNAYKHSRSARFPDLLTAHAVHVLQLIATSDRNTGDRCTELRLSADGKISDMSDVLKRVAAAWTDIVAAPSVW